MKKLIRIAGFVFFLAIGVLTLPLFGLPYGALSERALAQDPYETPPPDVTASIAGADVVLAWTHHPDYSGYEVWRSNQPYFAPGELGSAKLADVPPPSMGDLVSYTDVGVGADANDYFYVIKGLVTTGDMVSNPDGKISVPITPGSANASVQRQRDFVGVSRRGPR